MLFLRFLCPGSVYFAANSFLLTFWTLSCFASDLESRIQPLIDGHQGEVGVAIKHLTTGESFSHRADEPMPTASLIKLPVMIAAYQAIESGELKLNQHVTLRKEDKVPGSGILTTTFSDGAKFPLRDAIQLMIAYSDNTATNLVIDQIGLRSTAELMESLGCPHTKLHSKVYQRETSIFPERSRQFGLGSTTAAEMVKLLELLHTGEIVSKSACQKMIAHLSDCKDRSKLPRFLPSGTKVLHKTGTISAVRCDAGIIESPNGPIAICALTNNNEDRRWIDDNEADLVCARIAKEVFDHFNAESRDSNPVAVLKIGTSGSLVEALQRTLNTHLEVSQHLNVDGDFGPQTEAAVIAFQREKKLEQTGVVDQLTWAALGPLVDEDPAIPTPAVVNTMVVEKQPADELVGPPHVTCKVWAVGDGDTGELLWGCQQDQPRDFASLTKIMTAYLVTSYAIEHPKVLDQQIVFSQEADDTIGSTTGLRAGEQVKVKDLLYGLLLPSGNDAAVALAEFFGGRILPQGHVKDQSTSYEQFVLAMNNKAIQLGLNNTCFKNPNGLPEKGHRSTANDLMTLAYHAMQQPVFQEYVSTAQRGCTVQGAEGYTRNLLWRNTNRLLTIEGYDGIKTGTTRAAGACLAAHERRGDQSLIVVVLGATSSDARYVDARNIFRWAWNQRTLENALEDH